MEIDPKQTVEKQTGKFVIVCGIDESAKKPYTLVINKDTGELRVSAVIVSKTIGSITFIGGGLNDMTNGGEFTGTSDIEYEVEIDATGTPDTFKLTKNSVVVGTGIPIDGTEQDLGDGVTGKFNTTTGHTLANKWIFTARHADPTSIQKNMEQIIAGSFIGLGAITSSVVDLRLVKAATLTTSGDWNGAAALGVTVEIFTSPDNVHWDTEAWADTGLEPTVVAGTSFQKTSNLDTIPKFMKVVVTNLDALGLANLYVRIVKIQE